MNNLTDHTINEIYLYSLYYVIATLNTVGKFFFSFLNLNQFFFY